MIGLLGDELALKLGVATRIATVSGFARLLRMWSAVLPTANNPFMDDHIDRADVGVAEAGVTMLTGDFRPCRPAHPWRQGGVDGLAVSVPM